MNLSAPFIRRPAGTLLLALGTLMLGAVCYSKLPIASLPAVERPTISVSADLPGASADTVASTLCQPLERQLGIIPGIVEMAAFNATGGTQIAIQFVLEKDIDAAAAEVQAAINAAGPYLPTDLPFPPTYRKVNPGGFAVMALALTSDVLTPGDVYKFADSVLVQKLSQLPGVAQASISGAERSAVRIQASPRRLANMNVSLEQVRLVVRAATMNLPKGAIDDGERSYIIAANDQATTPEDYRDIVVAYRNGAPVRLGDVADVTDSVINEKLAGWFGDRRAVLVFVYKQPEANVVEIVDSVKSLLPQLHHWMPPAIDVHVLYDRTTLIRASIADVQFTIEVAIALVVLIVALFLKRLRATAVPVLTIPVVLAATVVVMRLAGYSLDNLSLMAITISVGFIVDDAVIIVENIVRLADEGNEPTEAALNGTRQMGFTIISITGALLGALVPILFMPDVVGRYFREFAVTLAAAIIASAIASLTLAPMLCSRPFAGSKRSEGDAWTSKHSIALRTYMSSLGWALKHPAIIVSLLLFTLVGAAALFVILPKGFMPTQDTGILGIRTLTISNVSFAAMERLQRRVTEAILRDPAVEGLVSYIGTDNGSPLSNGYITVSLKPLEQRKLSMQDVIVRLRQELGGLAEVRTFFTPWQDLLLGVQNTASRYQYTMRGTNPDELWRWSETMRQRMVAMPQLTDVVTTAERAGLEAGLVVDRMRAAAFGLTQVAINNTLYDAFGQRQIRTIYLPFNYSRVVLEVDPGSRTDPSVLQHIFVGGSATTLVSNTANHQVSLAALIRPRRAHAAMWLRHSDQFPSITLSFDTQPGVSIGEAIAAIRATETEIRLPDEIAAEFRGEAAEVVKSRIKQTLLILGAAFAIYVVLGMLYESYAHPFTIFSTLPSATFGALLALVVTGFEFTLVTSIACMLVIGIVMKNAIMMVDFALDAERLGGLSSQDSIMQAARLRVRPIIMTTLVAALSAIPLAVGTGPGHELRQPVGVAIVGGLLVSQILTLYTTPVVYLLINRLRSRAASVAP